MPYTISLPEKRVKINVDIQNILRFFEKAYQQGFKEESTTHASSILGDEKLRPGFVAKVIKLYEGVSDTKQGSTVRILPELTHVYLNPYAEQIYFEYISYLNQILRKCGCTAIETEATELDNPYVLMRELLLRLVALALSTEMRGDRDGERLITVLTSFIESVCQSDALAKKGTLLSSPELSSMQTELSSNEHRQWVRTFKATVEAIKILTAMNDLITQWLDLLKQRRYQISRYIIIMLDPKKKREDLSTNWINDTLTEIEKQLFLQANAILTAEKNLILFTEDSKEEDKIKNIPRAYKICQKKPSSSFWSLTTDSTKDTSPLVAEWLEKLYFLLQKTTILENLLANLEGIHSVLGWFPIIMGIINCQELDKIFLLYDKNYEDVIFPRFSGHTHLRGICYNMYNSGEMLCPIEVEKSENMMKSLSVER
jgi:hypothetical protein